MGSANDTSTLLQRAISAHQQGRLDEAEGYYLAVIYNDPAHFHALRLLGSLCVQRSLFLKSISYLDRALALNPRHAGTSNAMGVALLEAGDAVRALACFQKALETSPGMVDAVHNCGNAYRQLGQLDEACDRYLAAFQMDPSRNGSLRSLIQLLFQCKDWERLCDHLNNAFRLFPDDAWFHDVAGDVLFSSGSFSQALHHFSRSVALRSGSDGMAALQKRALAHCKLGNYESAITDYAMLLRSSPGDRVSLINMGNALYCTGDLSGSLAHFERARGLFPHDVDVLLGIGNVLHALRRYPAAVDSFDQGIALNCSRADLHTNRGNALAQLGDIPAAIGAYESALKCDPDFVDALHNLGDLLRLQGRYTDAVEVYSRGLNVAGDFEFLLGILVHTRMKVCDWRRFDDDVSRISKRLTDGFAVTSPFPLLALSDSPLEHLHAARLWSDRRLPSIARGRAFSTAPLSSPKIRVGYFSSDFYDHATAHLMAEVFENHDRQNFEWIAFSYTTRANDTTTARIKLAFDQFLDVSGMPDADIALLARDLSIHIAVDLKGYTDGGRVGIFCHRAAPVQVSYLGYPGSLGNHHMDYLIADPIVVPVASRHYYSEKIAYLSQTYQPNDALRFASLHPVTRASVGLPEDAFVFCCFNSNYKITPIIFDAWMRILQRCPDSVLWLYADNDDAVNSLTGRALAAGVDAEKRLFFANYAPPRLHLSRLSCADLFLDTFPYNAHTTARDALCSGVPIVTCAGKSFASRVAASLLFAVGLPQLVVQSLEDYEQLAVDLYSSSRNFALVRSALLANLKSNCFPSSKDIAVNLETLYAEMHERWRSGQEPAHLSTNNDALPGRYL